MRSILVVSKVTDSFEKIFRAFSSECLVDKTTSKKSALEIFNKKRYDFIFIDLEILLQATPNSDYGAVLQPFKQACATVEIVVMSNSDSIREAVKAVKAGASDYLTYPLDPEEIRLVAETIRESILKQSELDYLREQSWRSDSLEMIQTNSGAMQEVFKKIRSVAPTKTNVLLTGETGTGKGVLARLIHRHSNRESAQYICVHCGAVPDTLLESELFGHERGAFTGAVRKKLGKFEIAKGGTLFMDEIGTITPSAQIKLLQVLQDGTFNRVGGEETIKTNARVIAATNSDLSEMTRDGTFRKDLYYRLNVFPIEIPSLRERKEDIPLLVDFFLKKLNRDFQKDVGEIHLEVAEALQQYSWPGNIRELENLLERAYILETSSILSPWSFPVDLFEKKTVTAALPVSVHIPLTEARRQAVEGFERRYLKELISRNKGSINKSASEAGVSTRQLHKLLLKYGIRKEDYKI